MATKEKAYSDATIGDVYETLRDLEFCPHEELTDMFDLGKVRVSVSDSDDGVQLMRFTQANGRGGICYSVNFDWNTPMEIIAAAIRTAVDYQ